MCSKDAETVAESESFVKVQGSDIYFHCSVDEYTVLELNMKVRKLAHELTVKHLELGLTHVKPSIRIFIKSDGGEIFAGLSAMDCLKSLRKNVRITTVADGVCASAATFILLGGRHRTMTENSYVLIHQLNTDGFWGKFEEVKDEMKNLTTYMRRFRAIYAHETDLPEKKLKKLLRHDLYLDSKRCLKYNIVDSIF
jgi:ATP-dependent protease ClpP protease subunit